MMNGWRRRILPEIKFLILSCNKLRGEDSEAVCFHHETFKWMKLFFCISFLIGQTSLVFRFRGASAQVGPPGLWFAGEVRKPFSAWTFLASAVASDIRSDTSPAAELLPTPGAVRAQHLQRRPAAFMGFLQTAVALLTLLEFGSWPPCRGGTPPGGGWSRPPSSRLSGRWHPAGTVWSDQNLWRMRRRWVGRSSDDHSYTSSEREWNVTQVLLSVRIIYF